MSRSSMYKVLLADDEASIIESMKDHISWSEYQLEVAYTASTGKQAYDIILNNAPDIAILDIRMPGYSGLELSKIIFTQQLKTQVIIVSGYAEFSYAQKAIQYGVLGYCLKPVEYDEITTLLIKAVRNLTSFVPTNTADDFLNAISENDDEKIKSFLSANGLSSNKYYLASSISDVPLFTHSSVLPLCIGSSQYGYISTLEFCEEDISPTVSFQGVGIYPSSVCFEELRSAFYKCLAMCYVYFINPSCSVSTQYQEFSALPLTSAIQNAVSFTEKDRLMQLLNQLKDPAYSDQFTIHSAQQLHNLIISNQKLTHNAQDYYIYNYQQLVHEYDSFHDMIDNLILLIQNAESETMEYEDISNSYFLKIMKYINSNYNQNITLKDVANVVNLNANYISQVFKKTTGSTFSHYLTNLRISNAQKQLLSTNASINEIATQSGFNDYFYFLKTFKKYTGKTPSEYRNSDT